MAGSDRDLPLLRYDPFVVLEDHVLFFTDEAGVVQEERSYVTYTWRGGAATRGGASALRSSMGVAGEVDLAAAAAAPAGGAPTISFYPTGSTGSAMPRQQEEGRGAAAGRAVPVEPLIPAPPQHQAAGERGASPFCAPYASASPPPAAAGSSSRATAAAPRRASPPSATDLPARCSPPQALIRRWAALGKRPRGCLLLAGRQAGAPRVQAQPCVPSGWPCLYAAKRPPNQCARSLDSSRASAALPTSSTHPLPLLAPPRSPAQTSQAHPGSQQGMGELADRAR